MPRHHKQRCTLLMLLLTSGTVSFGTEPMTLDNMLRGWGTDLDSVTVTSEPVRPGLYRLTGAGGAVLASIGSDGTLIVDDQFAKTVGKLKAEVARLGGERIDFVVNTHFHFDHADGNPELGADGARIIAHSAARERMQVTTRVTYVDTHYDQPPYPPEGLPVITFDDRITIHFNEQRIDIMHFGPGHTDGDVAVFFRGDNVVHMGDVFSGGYPYIDAPNGGSLAGLIAICRAVLEEIDADTLIVPGHAPVTDRGALIGYISMLETVHGRLQQYTADGRSLEEVMKLRPTAEYDETRGNPTLFLTMAYPTRGR